MPIRLPNVELLTTNLCNVLVMMDDQARSFFVPQLTEHFEEPDIDVTI